ncbi:MAG: 3-hydroxyacyl-CoA dehydrogenase family protein [Clostridiales Family XIII bacterium]|jgi:3-hydroxybutyryl-CoA dehydrogenase|nr:3-hydroxyacyl-CoA dehydrogenase family protein [Clostridiales Family XIII bacterium]
MTIEKIGVSGAGVMGTGIAHISAVAGFAVVLRDIKEEFTEKAFRRIEELLSRSVEKGRLTEEEKGRVLSRVTVTTDAAPLADADLIIEAVVEDIDLKKRVFSELHGICKPDAIFATNTSSISVTEIASGSGRPELFCGLHFFNPVHRMRPVEIISGAQTEARVIDAVKAFAEAIGKVPVHVKKDSPGFIVNRLLVPYLNEAVRLVEEGVASPRDIDTAVELGLNYPVGPFKMIDTGGVDLTVKVLDRFREAFADEGYAPRETLREMLESGRIGRKSGEGFYKYGDD